MKVNCGHDQCGGCRSCNQGKRGNGRHKARKTLSLFIILCVMAGAVWKNIHRSNDEVNVMVAVTNMLRHMQNLDKCKELYERVLADLVLKRKAELGCLTADGGMAGYPCDAGMPQIGERGIADAPLEEAAKQQEERKSRDDALRSEAERKFRELPYYNSLNGFYMTSKVEIGLAKDDLLRSLGEGDEISGFDAIGEIKTLRLNPNLSLHTKVDMGVSMYLEKLADVHLDGFAGGEEGYFEDHNQVETILKELAYEYTTVKIAWDDWILLILPTIIFIVPLIIDLFPRRWWRIFLQDGCGECSRKCAQNDGASEGLHRDNDTFGKNGDRQEQQQ